MLIFLHRKEGLSHAEFKDHYENVHVPLTKELTGSLFPMLHSRRYIQRSPEDGKPMVLAGAKGEDEADAVVEVAFKDEAAAQAFFAATNSGEAMERLKKDNEQFLNWEKLRILKISEASKYRFCEEDYVFTRYIAEFINCLSNATYIYFALKYPRANSKASMPWYRTLDIQSVGLLLVGIFSGVFHGTMHQETQLLDDLSMLILAGSLVQPLYVYRQSSLVGAAVIALLWGGIGTMAVIYVRSGDIFIHVMTFTALLTFVWPRTLYLVYWTGLYSKEEKKIFMRYFWKAVFALIFGFTLWHIDLEYCAELRAARKAVGLPVAWFLELHGWWHIFTALGASWYMRLIRMVTEDGRTGSEKKQK
ncbi:Alkaline ceramidase YDC1 [Colletotrichum sp. SAR 10_99]|nr:Alkaline ceramidase YDC1 [Colletotrichum sp. SAR 10_96]KAJ5017850.1 Alkaline ceramidase YDC1 [Colletotrichum sp. SAR 10_99]